MDGIDAGGGTMDGGQISGGAGTEAGNGPAPQNNAGGGDAVQSQQPGQQHAADGAAGAAGDAGAAAGPNNIGAAERDLLAIAGIDQAAIDEAVATMGQEKGLKWLGRVIESQMKQLGQLGLPSNDNGQQQQAAPQQQQRQAVQQQQGQQQNPNRAQQGQQGAGQQAAAADPFADATLQAIREVHAYELVDNVLVPMKGQFDQLRQQLDQMQQVHQSQALQAGMDGFQNHLSPLLTSDAMKLKYGAGWDVNNQSQYEARQKLADRAYAIAQHYRSQGRKIDVGEALKLAFSVDNMQAKQATAVEMLRQEVKKAAGRSSIPPSSGRSAGAGAPKDEFADARQEINKFLAGTKKA